MDSIGSESSGKAEALILELYHEDYARYKHAYSRITNDF